MSKAVYEATLSHVNGLSLFGMSWAELHAGVRAARGYCWRRVSGEVMEGDLSGARPADSRPDCQRRSPATVESAGRPGAAPEQANVDDGKDLMFNDPERI